MLFHPYFNGHYGALMVPEGNLTTFQNIEPESSSLNHHINQTGDEPGPLSLHPSGIQVVIHKTAQSFYLPLGKCTIFRVYRRKRCYENKQRLHCPPGRVSLFAHSVISSLLRSVLQKTKLAVPRLFSCEQICSAPVQL